MDNSIETLYVDIRLRTQGFEAGLRDVNRQVAAAAGMVANSFNQNFNRSLGIQQSLSSAITSSGRAIISSSQRVGSQAGTTFTQAFTGNLGLNPQSAVRAFAPFSQALNQSATTAGRTAATAVSNAVNSNTNFQGAINGALTMYTALRAFANNFNTTLGSSVGNLGAVLSNSIRGMGSMVAQAGNSIGQSLGSSISVGLGIATAGMFAVMAKQMSNWAYEADNARISFEVWNRTVERAGIGADKATASIDNMSKSLKISKISLMENAAGLLRMGFTMDQVETAFTVASASAVRLGKDTTYGIEQVTQALLTGNSRFLNTIGIRLNLVDAEKMYAAQIGKTKSALTDSERLQAKINLLWKDSGNEVEYLAQSLSGLSGATSDNKIAMEQFRQTIGTAFIPVTNMAIRSVTELIQNMGNWAKNTEEGRRSMQIVSTAASNFGATVVNVGRAIVDFMKTDTFKDFASIAVGVFNEVKRTAGDVVTYFRSEWPKLSQSVGQLASEFKQLWDVVSPIISALKSSLLTISPIFTGIVTALSSMVSAIVKGIRGLVTAVGALLSGDWKGMWDGASTAITAFKDDLINWPVEKITSSMKSLISNISDLWASGGEAWGTAAATSMNAATDKAIADNQKKIEEYKKIIADRQIQKSADQVSPNFALNQVNDPLGLQQSGVVNQPKVSTQVPNLKPDLGLSSFMKALGKDLAVSVMQELGANHDKYRLTGGKGHPGIDYQIGSGTNGGLMGAPVYAPGGFAGATVKRADNTKSGYGNSIELELANGYKVLLGHFKDLGVKAGQKITEGMVLGTQGNTGWGFSKLGAGEGKGPVHLHVEARDIKGNIVFDKGQLESILTTGKAAGDRFINTVSDRQNKSVADTKAKPDPTFAELVKQLVAINREFNAAGAALKANPNSQAAMTRYQKANNALDMSKDMASTYKDENLYRAAQMATEKILENEGASYKINEAKVKKLLPEAVNLLKRQADLEGQSGVVPTDKLKEYYDVKKRIAAIGAADDGKEALSLAQKRIDAEKQGLNITDTMTAQALKLARALRDAKESSKLDPKALAAAQQAVDLFTGGGKSQQFALSWATDAVAKETKAIPAFESQIASAEKLVQALMKAQLMAFGPARTKAVNDASEAIKKFSESNKNAALAVSFAQEKYSKLQTITDRATAASRAKSIPLQTDTQLRDKIKAEQAKGAGADLAFIDSLQNELDKRTESLKKKRQDYANAFNDSVERLSIVGANRNVYDRAKTAIGSLLGDDPSNAVQDLDYLKALGKELDTLAKQPGGEIFGNLSQQLSVAIPPAQDLSDSLAKVADEQYALNQTDFSSSMLDQLQAQLDELIKSFDGDKRLAMDASFTDAMDSMQGAIDSMKDLPDLYGQTRVEQLQAALDQMRTTATDLAEGFEIIAQNQEEDNQLAEDYWNIQRRIESVRERIANSPLTVDPSEIDQMVVDLNALDQTDAVMATTATMDKLRDSLSSAQDAANGLIDSMEIISTRREEDNQQAEEYNAIMRKIADLQAAADTNPLLVHPEDIAQIVGELGSLKQDDAVQYQISKFKEWSDAIMKVRGDYSDLAETNARSAGTNSSSTGVIRAEVQDLRKQVTDLLADLTQFPGMTIVNDKQFDSLKVRLQRITDDPMFGNAAKEMADQLEKGWKEAQDAVQKQEVIDQERNASYEKQKAQEVAGYINESANALLDAFTATGNVEALLQDSKNLKVYIDGESIKGVSSTIDDILNSVETRVNRALGSVGHLHEAERKAIENDLLLNEMAFKAKTRSQEDYYQIRKELSTKALNLESTDLRDALDKQLSDGLLTQEQYWAQVEQLRSDGTTKLAQIDDDFKLPGIQQATEHFKELRDRVNQLSALNAPEVFPDIQKSIGVTLDEINNFAGKDLLTQDQQGQLSDFSKTLIDVSDNLANASDSTDQLASVVDGSVANIADALDELNTIVEQVTLGQIAPDDFLERMRLLKPILEGFDLSGLEIPQEVRAGLSEGLSTIKAFEGLYESSAPQAKVYGNAIKNLANDVKEFAAKSASGKMSVAEFNDTLAQLQNRISLIQQNPMNEGFFKIKTDDLSKQLGLVKFGQDAPETRKAVDDLTASLEGINKAFTDGLIDQPKYIELLGHLKDAFDALATSNATTDAVKKISIDSSKQISATLNGLKYLDSGVGAMFAKVAETVGKGTDKASKVMSIGLNTVAKVISGSKSPIQDALNGVFDMIVSAIETGSEAADGAINAFVGGLKGAFNAIMSGNYAGAVVSAVGGIIQGIVDWFNRANRAYEELKKKIGEFKEQLKGSFVDADQYVKKFYFTDGLSKKVFGDYMVTGIDEVGAKLALSISDGVTSGFKNGMKAAINGDDNWREIITSGMRDALIDGFIEAFIQKAVLQGILAAPLTALSKAFESGDQSAIDAAMAAFAGMLPKAMDAIGKVVPGFVDAINKAFPGMGNAGPGSLDFEQKKLADLQAKFGKATSDEERKKLQAQIDAQQAIIDKIKAKTEKEKPADAGPGSLDYENKILQDLMDKYNKETDAAKRLLLAGEIEKQKAKIKGLDPLNNPYKYGDIVKRNPDGSPDLTGGGTYITGNIQALPMLGVPDVPTGDTAIPFGTSVKNFGIHVEKFGEYMKYAEMIKEAAIALGPQQSTKDKPSITNWGIISKR